MSEWTNTGVTLADEARVACKKFLSSVLFVDDEIKMGEDVGEGLSATGITDAFAEESIVPSFYSCKHENQYEKILTLIRKTDVFVLDWKMSVKRASAEKNPDADADSAGGRGFFAQKLIDAVRSDAFSGPRLIFIYTSEIDEVVKYLKMLPREKIQPDAVAGMVVSGGDFEETLSQDAVNEMQPVSGSATVLDWVSADRNVRICAYFKDSRKGNYGVDQSRVLNETQLASAVLNEYAKLHEGILPITLLRLLSTVRDNTRPLMAKFNAKLDQAFVIDRAMTPEPLDADRMLIDMMLNSVAALNNENDMPLGNEFNLVKKWLNGNGFRSGKLKFKPLKNEAIDTSGLTRWQEIGYERFLREKMVGKWPPDWKQDDQKKKLEGYDTGDMRNDVVGMFSVEGSETSEISGLCRDYAVLSQWKRVARNGASIPCLTLGTVLLRNDSGRHYLCIQPSCDTYRIPSQGRDFLFLPLEEGEKHFDIILAGTGGAVRGLKVSMNPYDLVKVNFKPCEVSDTVVRAKPDQNGCSCFAASECDSQGNAIIYNWVGDLIETHAMKIVHDYISKFGRVGIDESEWLRRS